MQEDNNFLLFRWLKLQQEKEEQHQRQLAITRNKEDNEHYVRYLASIVTTGKYNKREGTLIFSLVKWNQEGRNYTDAQRSAIGEMYCKYILGG